MILGKRIQYLSILVITYMLISMGWWTILLNKKNQETYESKIELIKTQFATSSNNQISMIDQTKDIMREYKSQRTMIYGEAIVFGLMLIAGIWLIYNTFKKEYALSQQQNNFLLSITHELKTPLASIGLTLDTFKKRKLSDAQTQSLTNNALEETKRLENIVDNILVTSRLQTNPVLNKEQIDLWEMINELSTKLTIQYPNQKIINDVPISQTISADKESFKIVMKNIIENALKYSPSDSEIRLRAFSESSHLVIACEDQGEGISDYEKKRVTEKFYRVGSEETRKTKGTGLGLYLADQIIKSHGYELSIADNVPKGTIINIKIPQ